ncbi:MAG: hypothetical protein KAU95_00015 [Candidatus Aenigmarchaeota archaeon]|nr:hypothetical protein [Candidatus Aenigmarchaeota archaeon]
MVNLKLGYSGGVKEFQKLESEENIEQLNKDWEKELLIPHVLYSAHDYSDEFYPDLDKVMEKYAEKDEEFLKNYADKVYENMDEKYRYPMLNRVLSNVVTCADNKVVFRYVAFSKPEIGVTPNLGEAGGKVVLAEEMSHLIAQAMRLRYFGKKLAEKNEDVNIPLFYSQLDQLDENNKMPPEVNEIKDMSRHYAHGSKVQNYLPKDEKEKGEQLTDSIETAADYLRVKIAQEMLGDDAILSSYFSVGKFDPVYLRVEKKVKEELMKNENLTEAEANERSRKFIINEIIPKNKKKKDLASFAGNSVSELEKDIQGEVKSRARDNYLVMGAYIGGCVAFGSPIGYAMAKTGGAAYLPLLIGMRSLRRIPVKIYKDLGLSMPEIENKYVNKVIDASGKTMQGMSSAIGKAVRAGGKAKDKVSKKINDFAVYIGKEDWFDNQKINFTELDTKLSESTGNKWVKLKHGARKVYNQVMDCYGSGLIPIPSCIPKLGDYVIDIYWYGDTKVVKKKFREEEVKASMDDVLGAMKNIGIPKDYIEEFEKHREEIPILDYSELGSALGVMNLKPKYVFNEATEPYLLVDE